MPAFRWPTFMIAGADQRMLVQAGGGRAARGSEWNGLKGYDFTLSIAQFQWHRIDAVLIAPADCRAIDVCLQRRLRSVRGRDRQRAGLKGDSRRRHLLGMFKPDGHPHGASHVGTQRFKLTDLGRAERLHARRPKQRDVGNQGRAPRVAAGSDPAARSPSLPPGLCNCCVSRIQRLAGGKCSSLSVCSQRGSMPARLTSCSGAGCGAGGRRPAPRMGSTVRAAA